MHQPRLIRITANGPVMGNGVVVDHHQHIGPPAQSHRIFRPLDVALEQIDQRPAFTLLQTDDMAARFGIEEQQLFARFAVYGYKRVLRNERPGRSTAGVGLRSQRRGASRVNQGQRIDELLYRQRQAAIGRREIRKHGVAAIFRRTDAV